MLELEVVQKQLRIESPLNQVRQALRASQQQPEEKKQVYDPLSGMTLGLDVRRAFRSSKHPSPKNDIYTQIQPNETLDNKARHILGLDTTYVPTRNHSASSTTSISKPRITFSDATTAAVSAGSLTEYSVEDTRSEASGKGRSVLLERGRKEQEERLKASVSNTSLRSYYDKNSTPLNVSQQTSDSSSRDFALRRGAPSVITTTSQEMEHYKQLRLFSRSSKRLPQDENEIRTPKTPTLSSSRSVKSSNSDTSKSTVSRMSISRNLAKDLASSPIPNKHRVDGRNPCLTANQTLDPARAKVNVRRPKVGAKNWFDNIDSDSSDGENCSPEPQLESDFAVEVAAAFGDGRIDKFPPRSSSRAIHRSTALQSHPPHVTHDAKMQRIVELAEELEQEEPSKKRKDPFANVDLQAQSILNMSSSDDEEEDDLSEAARREIRESLMSGPWDDGKIEYGRALAIAPAAPEKMVQKMQSSHVSKPPIPPRAASRIPMTYLDDKSTETLTPNQDIMASFPRTPSESSFKTPSVPASRAPSTRESMFSDNESVVSTKLMTVTRQEETLIAAMRLKKIAMRKAQAVAHREGALRVLDANNAQIRSKETQAGKVRGLGLNQDDSIAALRMSYLPSARLQKAMPEQERSDSVTTFQTDSLQHPSVRSSIATYLSEGSEDLQLPYLTVAGTPSSSHNAAERTARPKLGKGPRETFLSGMTTESDMTDATTPTETNWSPRSSTRDSHVVVLDTLDRQLLREEIPSQLFMERPFLGWEARAINMQTAH